MIQEAGLARKPDDGREAWAFFRNRVTFPVGDKRGRIVAFGARLMEGEGPKYINSPDGPLFHKGQLLYGMARAAQAAGDGQPLIVAEGYMDVIALVRAGFEGAVAPLGTAVTEEQIEALWGMAPVPVLCFDGDNAGRRAAWRAIDRILPRLRPDHSARIAFLPEGEDPDSLIRARGGAAMQGVLEAAVPLAQLLFEREMSLHQIATPEGRAGLKAALEARARGIADIAVQYAYRRDLRDRFDATFPWKPQMKGGKPGAPLPGRRPSGLADDDSDRTALAILIVALAHHPDLFDEYGEALALLHVDDPALERARERVHERLTARVRASRRGDNPESDQALDPAEVRHHLTSHTGAGLSEAMVGRIERKWRVGPSVPIETARDACHVVLASVETRARRREVAAAAQALKDADSDADVVRWKMLNPESDLASGGGGR
jgi:DNA primase